MTSFSRLQFYSSPLGRRLVEHENRWLRSQLRTCVGSHAAIISSDPYARSSANLADFYLAVSASNDWQDRNIICCDAAALPFLNESLDVLILQHVTDGGADTLTILRETARVLMPGGRLLLLVENPLSLLGIRRMLHTETRRSPNCRNGLLLAWLSALDIQVQSLTPMLHELPINSEWLLDKCEPMAAWASRHKLPFGGICGFSAIKSARPVNPIRWRQLAWQPRGAQPLAANRNVQGKHEHD